MGIKLDSISTHLSDDEYKKHTTTTTNGREKRRKKNARTKLTVILTKMTRSNVELKRQIIQ